MAKKQFDFVGKRKIFLFISLGILLAGLITNIVMGTQLDINFKGGAIFTYSVSGQVDQEGMTAIAKENLGDGVETSFSMDVSGSSTQVTFTLTEIPSTVLTYTVDGDVNVEALKAKGQEVFGCETRVTYDKTTNQVAVDPVEIITNKMADEYTSAITVTATDAPAYTLESSNTVSELGDDIYEQLVEKYGTKLVYSVNGEEVDTAALTTEVENALLQKVANGDTALADITMTFDEAAKTITVVPATGDSGFTEEFAKVVTATLQEQLPDGGVTLSTQQYNQIALVTSNSVKATVGQGFFIKCIFAMILGGIFLTLYIGIRFRKIGGFSAGIFATMALIHDILIAYLAYVVFQIPLNDNFIAVVLTILGYSINGTIVVYDRIRENERKYGDSKSITEIVNESVNQTFNRNVFTSLTTLIAVVCIAVVAKINGLDSIISFALPMAVGLVAGFYSSVLLSSPLWAWWKVRKEK